MAERKPQRPTTMKAAIYRRYGPADVVEFATNIPTPSLQGYDEVLVKIHAASINPVDYKVREGRLSLVLPNSWPKIPGMDFSGVIVAIGQKVTKFKVGDGVIGMCPIRRFGTCAEYLAISENNIALKPPNLTHIESATLPLVGLTVWQSLLDSARLMPGKTVLILGGAGGTGSFAIQLAKNHLSATRVITTCSGRNFDYVRSLGADEVIDYTTTKWNEKLRGAKLDCVMDCVGGADNSYDLACQVLKSSSEGGSYVTIAPGDQKTGFSTTAGLFTLVKDVVANKTASLFGSPSYYPITCRVVAEQLAAISELAKQGKIKPEVAKIFPLDQTKEALKMNEEGRTRGKIIVRVVEEGEGEEERPEPSSQVQPPPQPDFQL